MLALQNCIWGSLGHVGAPPAAVFFLCPRLPTKEGVYPLWPFPILESPVRRNPLTARGRFGMSTIPGIPYGTIRVLHDLFFLPLDSHCFWKLRFRFLRHNMHNRWQQIRRWHHHKDHEYPTCNSFEWVYDTGRDCVRRRGSSSCGQLRRGGRYEEHGRPVLMLGSSMRIDTLVVWG